MKYVILNHEGTNEVSTAAIVGKHNMMPDKEYMLDLVLHSDFIHD